MTEPADTGTADRPRSGCVRALLFDLDGVLWDSNPLHAEVVDRVCAEAGLETLDFSRLAGLSTPEAFALVLAENGEPSGCSVAELTQRKRSLFQERIGEVPRGEEPAVVALKTRSTASLGLVTGASIETAEAYLRRVPTGVFDLVITANDGLASKPAPDAYLEAARRLGVSPNECVVFEDSRAGLEAARRAGMRTAHVTFACDGGCDGIACRAEWCARSVAEALEMVWSELC